jgi:hypothetical protein
MQQTIAVGISLPKKIMSQIDSERGDVSRSRFLRLIERQRMVSNVETKNVNDPLINKYVKQTDVLGQQKKKSIFLWAKSEKLI